MPDRSQERWLANLAGEATPHPPKVSQRLQPSNSVGEIRLVRVHHHLSVRNRRAARREPGHDYGWSRWNIAS